MVFSKCQGVERVQFLIDAFEQVVQFLVKLQTVGF